MADRLLLKIMAAVSEALVFLSALDSIASVALAIEQKWLLAALAIGTTIAMVAVACGLDLIRTRHG